MYDKIGNFTQHSLIFIDTYAVVFVRNSVEVVLHAHIRDI